MTRQRNMWSSRPSGQDQPGARPPRRRHWWRWIAGGVVALVVVAVGGTGLAVTLTPQPAPLALPKEVAGPSGPLDRTWRVGTGSVAGFRIRETVIGFSNDVTGRTGDVSGTVVLAGSQVSRAAFQVSLTTIAVNGKARQPQLVQSLGVTLHPDATLALTRPLPLPSAFSTGGVVTTTAMATLTLNGITRPVTVSLSARRDGVAIDAAGSLPVSFASFGITGPRGYGAFGALASNGTAEFMLILRPGSGDG
ncbi:MAG TPA: YceI family protein [Trebonia sp.]|nr:YceI family protein [Trebonia sp.]